VITTFPNMLFETWTLTLVHSLWQGLLIFLLVKIILKFVPLAKSSIRYVTVVTAFTGFLLVNIFTFYLILPEKNDTSVYPLTFGLTKTLSGINIDGNEFASVLETSLLDHSSVIMTLWLLGAGIFMSRLTGSWWYIQFLTNTGATVSGLWNDRVSVLTSQLGVTKMVRLIESTRIDTPFVAGVLRPVIFIPVGLTTGLSPQQLEAIFVHEIIHIKRNDYLVNLFQSVIESMYFFNPFVWMISNIIKTEREHCCDDAVVNFGADKRSYVIALASLEENRLYKNGLALSASANKNQLFNRIKRLMEGSTKNYSLREKLVPVLLLLVGFICASWFSIQRGYQPEMDRNMTVVTVADTVIKKKVKNEKVTKVKTTKTDKGKTSKAKETEITYEYINEDNDFMPVPAMPEFEMPLPPDLDLKIIIPHIAELEDVQIPPMPMPFANNYPEEFLEKFKDHFGDFYEKNQVEIDKMMEEIEQETFVHVNPKIMEANSQIQAALAMQHEKMSKVHKAEVRIHEEQTRKFEQKMKLWEDKNKGKIAKMEAKVQQFEKDLDEFNNELRKELIRDGYLDENEAIERLKFVDDVLKEVNGKDIKETDQKKYQELYQNSFPKMKETED
jgi:bla regulator protein blaR1